MITIFSKERGRPPKDYSVVENQPIIDCLDSPPKAKRKSRPPRRHKPHYDPRDETMSHGSGANEAGPSSGPSSFYEYPGIHYFFSTSHPYLNEIHLYYLRITFVIITLYFCQKCLKIKNLFDLLIFVK